MGIVLADPVVLCRGRSPSDARAIGLTLERAGIPTALEASPQDAPSGLTILVTRSDESAARALLERGDGSPRHCLACGATYAHEDACPKCAWPRDAVPTIFVKGTGSDFVPADEPRSDPVADPISSTGRWWEVAAVMAVGVVPNLLNAVVSFIRPSVFPVEHWVDSLELSVMSGCTIFVTLYLIHRSGEPFSRFGITRPHVSDLFFGALFLMAGQILWMFVSDLFSGLRIIEYYFQRPVGAVDHVMMVLKFSISAFAEELVTRTYLITRLETLLRSRTKAVLLAAVVFSSYHLYQGVLGVIDTFLFGVMYGAAYLALRRIWPLVLGHMLYNVWGTLLG